MSADQSKWSQTTGGKNRTVRSDKVWKKRESSGREREKGEDKKVVISEDDKGESGWMHVLGRHACDGKQTGLRGRSFGSIGQLGGENPGNKDMPGSGIVIYDMAVIPISQFCPMEYSLGGDGSLLV